MLYAWCCALFETTGLWSTALFEKTRRACRALWSRCDATSVVPLFAPETTVPTPTAQAQVLCLARVTLKDSSHYSPREVEHAVGLSVGTASAAAGDGNNSSKINYCGATVQFLRLKPRKHDSGRRAQTRRGRVRINEGGRFGRLSVTCWCMLHPIPVVVARRGKNKTEPTSPTSNNPVAVSTYDMSLPRPPLCRQNRYAFCGAPDVLSALRVCEHQHHPGTPFTLPGTLHYTTG